MRDAFRLRPSIPFIAVLLIVVVALALGNPHDDKWLLQCPLYQLTGIKCPLCGGQRAVHELLHLDIKEAWMLNPGLFVLSPYLLLLLAGQLFPQLQESSRIIRFCYRDKVIFLFFAVLSLWGVVRNLFA